MVFKWTKCYDLYMDYTGVSLLIQSKLVDSCSHVALMHEKTLLIQLNFGTTDSGEIYYRVGTHRNIDSLGTSWQRIPGVLTHITSGINRVYGVDSSKKLWKMNSDVSFNEQGEMTWQESPWELITERSGSYVSAL